MVSVDVGHVDDAAAVALCEVCDASTVTFMLPQILDRLSPVLHIAVHPHRKAFLWRCIAHQEVRLTDGDCITDKVTHAGIFQVNK